MKRYIFFVATGLLVFLAPCVVTASSFYYKDVLSMSKDGLGLFNTSSPDTSSYPPLEPDNEGTYDDPSNFPPDEYPDYLDQSTGGEDTTAPVPEPATMLLLGTGLIGIAGLRKRLNKD